MANDFNPIKSVTPCTEAGTATGSAVTTLPCPSSYTWDMEDTSAPDAGRTLDGAMHKKRVGQVIALNLSWRHITDAEVSAILKAFNSEYVLVEHWDAMQGAFRSQWALADGGTEKCVFYVGNRTAPMYNKRLGLWENLSFKIIERIGKTKATS